MLFSMLANLAEDRQGVATEQDADLAAAIARLNAEGIGADAVIDLLDHGLIAPVLTAHPTEVRRKSMIDHRNRIADLMALKDQIGRANGRTHVTNEHLVCRILIEKKKTKKQKQE